MLSVVIFAALWPFANGPLEGHTLANLGSGHGITESDMLSVLAFVIAAVQVVRLGRRTPDLATGPPIE